MKIKLLCILLLFIAQLGYSQIIKGKVTSNNYPAIDVEIINATTKTIAVSDSQGEFTITAKNNDEILFISKNHESKKLVMNPLLFTNNELVVDLVLKAEQLKEVKITNMASIKLGQADWEQQKLDDYDVQKNAVKPNVQGVYMGGIPNGMNFVRIAGMVANLFKKDKDPQKKEKELLDFKTFTDQNCKSNYFTQTLGLKVEEVELFKEYCTADPLASQIVSENNKLRLMDFLFEKSISFKKL
ncbi:hypothetical protein [Flavobacterium faecale]|nr:hypothetical protein [Flavobacterium faecale]